MIKINILCEKILSVKQQTGKVELSHVLIAKQSEIPCDLISKWIRTRHIIGMCLPLRNYIVFLKQQYSQVGHNCPV